MDSVEYCSGNTMNYVDSRLPKGSLRRSGAPPLLHLPTGKPHLTDVSRISKTGLPFDPTSASPFEKRSPVQ